jgi:surface carbohydrate biosynthesis protein
VRKSTQLHKKTFYIPIEIFSREYEAKIFLSCFLAGEGWRVVVGHKWHVTNLALQNAKPQDVFLDKHFYSESGCEYLEELRSREVVLVSLDEEAGLNYPNYGSYADETGVTEGFKYFDIWMCWGERDHEYLGRKQVSDTKLLQIGTPRSAVWGDFGKILHKSAAADITKKYGEFVLLATSFVWENSTLSPELYDEIFMKYGKNQAQQSIAKLNEGMSADRDNINLSKALALVNIILEETNLNIVIRRHPLEKPELAKQLLIDPKRIFLDNHLNISPILLACKSVLHMGSTIAIEALSYGKPVASVSELFSDSKFDSQELSTVLSQRPVTKAELLEFLRVELNSSNKIDSKILSPYGEISFYSNLGQSIVGIIKPEATLSQKIGIIKYLNLKGIIGTYITVKSRDNFRQLDRAKRPNMGFLQTRRIVKNALRLLGISGDGIKLVPVSKSTYLLELRSAD